MHVYLSISEFAERADVNANTMKYYFRKELIPPADARIGSGARAQWFGWLPATVDAWIESRSPAT